MSGECIDMRGAVNRVAVLLIGTMVLLVLGLIYAWSIFVAPLEAEFGWSRSETSLTFSISMMMWSIGMLVNGRLSQTIPLRACYAIGASLIAVGFILSSQIGSLPQLYIFYGVFCGFGTGLCYNLWTSAVLQFFPDKAGFASGFLLMGFGMGSFVLGSVVSASINSPLGWRGTFGILTAIVVIVLLVSIPFLRRPDVATLPPKAQKDIEAVPSLTGKQMLASTPFWTFTLWRVLAMGAGAAVIAQAAPLMAELGTDAVVQAFAVGALAIGNGCGRPIIGAIYDKLGRDRTLVVLPCAGFLAGVLLVASYLNGMSALFAVALFCEGVVYGGYASINVSFIETTFGGQYLSMNIGINSFLLMPFNVVFPLFSAFVFQTSGGYAPYLAMLPVIALISLFAGFITKPAIQHMRKPRS